MILILLHVRDPGFHGRAAEQRSEASGNDGFVFPRQEGRVWLPALAPGPAGREGTARAPQHSPALLAPRAGRSTPLPEPPSRGTARLLPGQGAG